MMNAIRMVWVISRHYNTDERMVPLMELIAGEIAGKVQPESFLNDQVDWVFGTLYLPIKLAVEAPLFLECSPLNFQLN